ncbi:MAG: hypothetical protein J0L84_17090 [Verrucomicrobia bacterium]|nr:hypothetical protein [Verrucomicrobiota bacterium]
MKTGNAITLPLVVAGILAVPGMPAAGTPRWDLTGVPRVGDTTHELGRLAFRSLEVSGVVLSRTRVEHFWAIQDDRSNVLIAFNAAGDLVQAVAVTGLDSDDLEDIAADNQGWLYLADTGTNLRPRDEVRVHRVREPGPGVTAVAVERTWRLRWPEAGRDCESLVVHGGHGWLVSKVRDAGQRTTLARFSLSASDPVLTLEVLGDLDISSPAAAADLTPDGGILAISTRAGLYSWGVDGDPASAVRRAPRFSPSTPDTKKEGLAFVPQGLLVVTETRDRYLDIATHSLPPAPGPRLDPMAVGSSGAVRLDWTAPYGVSSVLEHRASLAQGTWVPLGPPVPGLGPPLPWPRDLPPAGFLRLTTDPP